MLSPRVAPQMIGLGLLEAVYDSDIERLADPEDADGDGISGRVNRVWDDARQAVVPGRFGWKVGQPSVHQQSLHAMNGDIGISTPGMPPQAGACPELQPQCLAAPDGHTDVQDGSKASAAQLDLDTKRDTEGQMVTQTVN